MPADAGVQSRIDVASSPVIPNNSWLSQPHFWAWAWFVLAVVVVLGFHVRVFGHPIPPGANFP
jgi:hypothetical protein